MTARYLEDFTVGQTFGSGRLRIDEEQIRRFASEFDPQPFHLDDKGDFNQIVYWSTFLDSKNQTLTPNPDTIYFKPFFNTNEESSGTRFEERS